MNPRVEVEIGARRTVSRSGLEHYLLFRKMYRGTVDLRECLRLGNLQDLKSRRMRQVPRRVWTSLGKERCLEQSQCMWGEECQVIIELSWQKRQGTYIYLYIYSDLRGRGGSYNRILMVDRYRTIRRQRTKTSLTRDFGHSCPLA